MPELPEVETIRRDLEDAIVGRRVFRADILDASLVQAPSPKVLACRLAGLRVCEVARRAKYLLLRLDHQWLVFHLMMSGRIQLQPSSDRSKHTRLVITFDRGPALHFVDTRRFGRAWLLSNQGLGELTAVLGPEPLEPEFDGAVLYAALSGRRRPIKSALLDQKTIAGVGNIYADESLWLARIHPSAPAGSLSRRKVSELADAIVTVLNSGIQHGGTSFLSYADSRGKRGRNLERLKVFRRTGQSCPRCGRAIKRLVVGQRSTHMCPGCQRLRG